MKTTTDTTTTHPPAVNFETRKMTVDSRGGQRPHAVDGGPPSPARRSRPVPVDDEPDLRQREAGEDADGEHGDQALRVAAHGHEEHGREHGQDHDAVAEVLAVAAHREDVGQVVVPGQEAGEHG